MYKVVCLLIICHLIALAASAQNLVPNPGFEQMIRCPYMTIEPVDSDFIERYTTDWYDSGNSIQSIVGSEYYNECQKRSISSDPHSGKGMAVISRSYGVPDFKIFLGVKLLQPLIKNHDYKLRFFTRLISSYGYSCDKLGVMFYSVKMKLDDLNLNGYINGSPNRAHFYAKQVLNDVSQWVELGAVIKADSDYQYMVVGYFFDQDQTQFVVDSIGNPYNVINYFLDDFSLEEVSPKIYASDTLVCKDDSLLLTTQGEDPFFWWSLNKKDTFSLADSITIKPDSIMKVYLISSYLTDSVTLTVIPRPQKVLAADTLLCEINPILLHAETPFGTYQWNTGDTSGSLLINYPGTYFVKTQTGTCSRTDTIDVSACPSTLFFPTAFTPNGDGLNDLFIPKGVLVYHYSLEVFNRWGQLIFKSNDMNNGWSGENSPADVYFYHCIYQDPEGNVPDQNGSVTLIR